MLGCLCDILGEVGWPLKFSAKLERWPIEGLDGVRDKASLVEGVRTMFDVEWMDGGFLLVGGGGEEWFSAMTEANARYSPCRSGLMKRLMVVRLSNFGRHDVSGLGGISAVP